MNDNWKNVIKPMQEDFVSFSGTFDPPDPITTPKEFCFVLDEGNNLLNDKSIGLIINFEVGELLFRLRVIEVKKDRLILELVED